MYFKIHYAALALALACQGASAAPAVSLAQAQQRALAHSSRLKAQDAAIAAAREMAVAAGRLPDPVLKAGIDNLPASGPDRFSPGADFMTMRRLGIEQELTSREKRSLRASRFEQMAAQASAEQGAAAAAVERDTALAWLDLHYATRATQLVAGQVSQAQAELAAQEAAYRGARASQADLLAARSALVLAQDRAATAERQRLNARTMLARWVGETVDIAGDRADITHLRHDPDTLDDELDHHPEVGVLRRAEDVARTEARLAAAESRPDWKVEFSFQQRGRDYPNMVSFGVAVPLQWDRKHRQDRETAARTAQAAQARDEREEAQRMHTAETRNLVGEWRTGLERMHRYEHELVLLARQRAEAVLAAYRGGKAQLADVLAARSSELDTRLQSLQVEAETARTWARLNFLFPTAAMESFATKEQK
ncbi:MAG TPA: TolC family protein [Telluria sp.]|nr:TolC family protein [Telluria sp.]